MKNNIKFVLVLFVLLIFGISCAYATNETSDVSVSDDTVAAQSADVNKVITKTNTQDKKVKTGYNEITSYTELSKELTDNEQEKTVYLKEGTYKITNPISTRVSNLVINGNGAVIDGSNSKTFLSVSSNNKVTINDLVIKNTKGASEGAITISDKATLNLNNCTFLNTVSNDKGGAITNRGTLNIDGCTFTSSSAIQGGAIWSNHQYGGNLKIENSKFIKNNANSKNNYDKTGVIYIVTGGKTNIINNVFENNNGRSIHAFKANTLISGNTFKNIVLKAPTQTIRGAVIDNYEANMNIVNNIFNTITISAKSVKGGLLYDEIGTSSFENNKVDKMTVSSTEKSDSLNGGIIFNRNAQLTVNDNIFNNVNKGYKVHGGVLYNNIGTLNVYYNTFNPKNTASNEISGGAIYNDKTGNKKSTLYYGENNFNGVKNTGKVISSTIHDLGIKKIVTPPKKATKITLNKVKGTLGDTVSIQATVTDGNGIGVTSGSIVFNVNGKKATVKTSNDGVFTYKYKTSKVGSNTVAVSFAANNKYKASSAKTTFTVSKKVSKLTINKIVQKVYGDKFTISGKLVDNSGAVIKNVAVKVKVNKKTVSVKTNAYGVFSTKVVADKVGKNNVTVYFAGNANIKGVGGKATFTVAKKASKVSLNKIADKTVGDSVVLTGKLTDVSGAAIKNATIRLRVNSNVHTVKTNNYGVYTYKVTASKVGTNKVILYYPATANYKGCNLESTFKVVKATE